MLSYIKWDIKKIWRSARYVLLAYGALLLTLALLPLVITPGSGEARGLLALLNVSAVLGCCCLALYPTYDLLNYFKGRQRLLERSAGLTLRQVLPAKLAVNLALVMLSLILAWIGSGLIGRFNTEHLSYFRLRGENISWPFLLFFSAGLPILWTFLNLVLSRRLPMLSQTLAFIGIFFFGPLFISLFQSRLSLAIAIGALALMTLWLDRNADDLEPPE